MKMLLEFYEAMSEIQSNSEIGYVQEYINECSGFLTEAQAVEAYDFLVEAVGDDIAEAKAVMNRTIATANAAAKAGRMSKGDAAKIVDHAKAEYKKTLKNTKGLFKRTRGAIASAKLKMAPGATRMKNGATSAYKSTKGRALKTGTNVRGFATKNAKTLKTAGKVGAGAAAAGAAGYGIYRYAKSRKKD